MLGSFEKLCSLIKLDTDFSFQIGKGRNQLSDTRLPHCSLKLQKRDMQYNFPKKCSLFIEQKCKSKLAM